MIGLLLLFTCAWLSSKQYDRSRRPEPLFFQNSPSPPPPPPPRPHCSLSLSLSLMMTCSKRSILMMSKVMMADELTNLQDVYLHAVTRHVLLQREADAYLASTRAPPPSGESKSKNRATSDANSGPGGRGETTPHQPQRHYRDGGGAGAGGGEREGDRSSRSRRRRKKEGEGERRARLVEVAGRMAPAVGFEGSGGSLEGIRCVCVFVCLCVSCFFFLRRHFCAFSLLDLFTFALFFVLFYLFYLFYFFFVLRWTTRNIF